MAAYNPGYSQTRLEFITIAAAGTRLHGGRGAASTAPRLRNYNYITRVAAGGRKQAEMPRLGRRVARRKSSSLHWWFINYRDVYRQKSSRMVIHIHAGSSGSEYARAYWFKLLFSAGRRIRSLSLSLSLSLYLSLSAFIIIPSFVYRGRIRRL